MHHVSRRATIVCCVVAATAWPCADVVAGGPVHGAKAAAMGTAFTALADDPSAMVYNPAGLTRIRGTHTYGGGTFVIPTTTYQSPSGQTEITDPQVFVPGHMYATSDFGLDDFTAGIGLYSPFGIGGRKWDRQGLTRYQSTKSMIATLWVNPSVAYRLLPTLSVGVGLDYMLAQSKSERMIDQSVLASSDGRLDPVAMGQYLDPQMGHRIPAERVVRATRRLRLCAQPGSGKHAGSGESRRDPA